MDQVAQDDTHSTTTTNSSQEINTAADLARLRNDGQALTLQELKELNTWIKAFEEMAWMEDRLRALESWKQPWPEPIEDALSVEVPTVKPRQPTRTFRGPPSYQSSSWSHSTKSTESDDSDSSSSSAHPSKRRCFTRGIKVTPSYTLKVSSSLRE